MCNDALMYMDQGRQDKVITDSNTFIRIANHFSYVLYGVKNIYSLFIILYFIFILPISCLGNYLKKYVLQHIRSAVGGGG